VRGGVSIDNSGNLRENKPGCGVGLWNPNSCTGPMRQSFVDASGIPGNFVPLLGDGAPTTTTLPAQVGSLSAGEPLAGNRPSPGARLAFANNRSVCPGTPRGPQRLVGGVEKMVLRTTAISAWCTANHRNILFADGSVR
jgi:prepilin-type processing-associated H-X9-DG protein